MSSMRLGVMRCALAAALFGAATPLAARIAGHTSAALLAGLLYAGAAIAVVPFARRRPVSRAALRRGGRGLVVAVVAGGFAGPLLFAAGLARTPGATASLLMNLEVVATTVIAVLFFREAAGQRLVAGTSLVVAAGAVLAWTGAPELRIGALLIVGACLCWGLDSCVTAALDDLAPEHITLAKGVIAGGTNLALGALTGGHLPPGGEVIGALVIGALGYGASITLWVAGARDLGAARGQLVFATAPFIGVLVAWGVLGEPVRGAEVVAIVLAGVGATWVVRSGHEHPHPHERQEHTHEHAHDDGHHEHGHTGRHTHPHVHEALAHAHPHVPDLHHRHPHDHG